MSNRVIAFLVAISAGTWLYTKMLRRTGNNVKNSLLIAAISGGLLFVFLWMVLNFAEALAKHH
ncbi:MAG TPA: hypothetical protein VMR51_00220 [Patescibacteria group bacterium]|nr:hypothetical protein [Patescibacteria group bacterium]